MSLILTDEQQCPLSIQPVTAAGHPAPVDGVPTWASSDPTVADLVVAADGLSADVVSGNLGTAQISVNADADLGTGVTTITGVLDVQVVAAQAVTLAITAGTPELKS